ncbi:DUF945 family protein [Massilia sp. METH4]|uniref:DUF945 family protein n=1 Tax=Massilia sp. METH4 TaxID=3123041 RepID=UPI0030D2CF73
MKALLLAATITAASATAAAPSPARPEATAQARAAAQKPKPTVAQLAMQGLERLLRDSLQPGPKPAPAPTAQQRAAMKTVFGSEKPVRVQNLPKSGTSTVQRLTLPAHQYSANGTTVRWGTASVLATRSADGRQLDSEGRVPLVTMRGAGGSMELKEGITKSAQRRAGDGLWIGTMVGNAESLVFNGPKGPAAHLARPRFVATTTERGDRIDQRIEMDADRLTVAGEDIDALHLAYQLNGLDRAMLRRMAEQGAGDPEQVIKQLKELALSGAELKIDDLSGRYKGHTASIQGSIALPGVTAEDLETPQRALARLAMHFEVTVPLGLLREVAAVIAARNQGNKDGQAPTAEQVYEGMVGKAVSNGYARVEGEAMRSTIEWRDGGLVVNGKPVALPGPRKGAAPAAAGAQ